MPDKDFTDKERKEHEDCERDYPCDQCADVWCAWHPSNDEE